SQVADGRRRVANAPPRLDRPVVDPADGTVRRVDDRSACRLGHGGDDSGPGYVDPVRKWVLLGAAIVTEVAATLALRAAHDHGAWLVAVVAGYACAFTLLTLVLREGLPVGVTYGIWGAT